MDQSAWLGSQVWYFHFVTQSFSRCMIRAEEVYGRRDTNWSFAGFTFDEDGPQTRYPIGKDKRFIGIELNTNAIGDQMRSTYQIAHEVVHCLSPDLDGARMIEEGAAVALSLDPYFVSSGDYLQRCEAGLSDKYREALDLYRQISAIHPDAIRRLRRKSISFNGMTPAFIQRWCPGVSSRLAEALSERVQMRDAAIAAPA